jgi:hypothetical protein
MRRMVVTLIWTSRLCSSQGPPKIILRALSCTNAAPTTQVPGRVKTLRGITAPGILRLVVTLRAKKMQKVLLRSALQPN